MAHHPCGTCRAARSHFWGTVQVQCLENLLATEAAAHGSTRHAGLVLGCASTISTLLALAEHDPRFACSRRAYDQHEHRLWRIPHHHWDKRCSQAPICSTGHNFSSSTFRRSHKRSVIASILLGVKADVLRRGSFHISALGSMPHSAAAMRSMLLVLPLLER
jgi:hypothetical protein